MQLLWALLDVATIVVLGTGLYLWNRRRNASKVRVAQVEAPPLAAHREQA
jgi:uncharacterized iron-regulated membrane protein